MESTDKVQIRLTLYQAASQHWAHAEQIRWTLLYNYLMASTILLLAWATIFASNNTGPLPRYIQAALAIAGAILSAMWVALGARATGFVSMYADTGRALEPRLGATTISDTAPLGPFASASQYRLFARGIGRMAPSHFVLWLVPVLFLLLYLLLSYVSLRQALEPSRVIPSCLPISFALAFIIFSAVSARHIFWPATDSPSAHGYCIHCAGALQPMTSDGRVRLECTTCGRTHYWQLIVGAGGLIEKDGQLLLVKRAHAPFAGFWGLPGGHVEADESPDIAAVREVEEETGLRVAVKSLDNAFFFTDHPRGSGIFLVYRCGILGGTLTSTVEAQEQSFFAPDKVPEALAGGGHRAAIDSWLEQSRK